MARRLIANLFVRIPRKNIFREVSHVTQKCVPQALWQVHKNTVTKLSNQKSLKWIFTTAILNVLSFDSTFSNENVVSIF